MGPARVADRSKAFAPGLKLALKLVTSRSAENGPKYPVAQSPVPSSTVLAWAPRSREGQAGGACQQKFTYHGVVLVTPPALHGPGCMPARSAKVHILLSTSDGFPPLGQKNQLAPTMNAERSCGVVIGGLGVVAVTEAWISTGPNRRAAPTRAS